MGLQDRYGLKIPKSPLLLGRDGDRDTSLSLLVADGMGTPFSLLSS
jgi:hypothetical protein